MELNHQTERRVQTSHLRLTEEQKEIEKLIEEENDAQIRLQLMIMNRINLSLIANTKTIHEIGAKLEEHLTNYEARTKVEDEILNKGKGAWKVIAVIIGIIQAIGLILWNDVRTTMDKTSQALLENSYSHSVFDLRVKKLEEYHYNPPK
jgi:hypothetical protein